MLVGQAWFCQMLTVMGEIAGLLDEPAEAERYATLAAEARAAFVREYVTPAGRLMSDSETAHALAVRFSLVPPGPQRDRIDARLGELVRASGHHITTGFAGTPIITDALCDAGAVDDAYRLLLQEEPLSWLYAVTMGATTVWERWDGLRPDGTLNPGEMNSFNHYALGSVADWLHRSVAGLAPGAPGYRRLLVQPLPGPGLTSAAARLDTPYGRAEVAWHIDDDQLELRVVVPPNTDAEVHVPGRSQPVEVGSGTHAWRTEVSAGALGPSAG
jgi:alpha-L-rhamnosidase